MIVAPTCDLMSSPTIGRPRADRGQTPAEVAAVEPAHLEIVDEAFDVAFGFHVVPPVGALAFADRRCDVAGGALASILPNRRAERKTGRAALVSRFAI